MSTRSQILMSAALFCGGVACSFGMQENSKGLEVQKLADGSYFKQKEVSSKVVQTALEILGLSEPWVEISKGAVENLSIYKSGDPGMVFIGSQEILKRPNLKKKLPTLEDIKEKITNVTEIDPEYLQKATIICTALTDLKGSAETKEFVKEKIDWIINNVNSEKLPDYLCPVIGCCLENLDFCSKDFLPWVKKYFPRIEESNAVQYGELLRTIEENF